MSSTPDSKDSTTSESEIPWTESKVAYYTGLENNFVPDILCTMFTQQRQLIKKYAHILEQRGFSPLPEELYGELSHPEVQAHLRETASYLVEELYEAINHLHNKPWCQTLVLTDEGAFLEEIADAWHFFIEFHILAGFTAKDVFRAYFSKAFINVKRQNEGY